MITENKPYFFYFDYGSKKMAKVFNWRSSIRRRGQYESYYFEQIDDTWQVTKEPIDIKFSIIIYSILLLPVYIISIIEHGFSCLSFIISP